MPNLKFTPTEKPTGASAQNQDPNIQIPGLTTVIITAIGLIVTTTGNVIARKIDNSVPKINQEQQDLIVIESAMKFKTADDRLKFLNLCKKVGLTKFSFDITEIPTGESPASFPAFPNQGTSPSLNVPIVNQTQSTNPTPNPGYSPVPPGG